MCQAEVPPAASPVVTAPAKRGALATTIPLRNADDSAYKAITKRTLREAIPPELFVRSYFHSFAHLLGDLICCTVAMVVTLAAASYLPWFCAPLVWVAYWCAPSLRSPAPPCT